MASGAKSRKAARVRKVAEDGAGRHAESAIKRVKDGASQGLVKRVPVDSPQVPAGEGRLGLHNKVGAQEAQGASGTGEE